MSSGMRHVTGVVWLPALPAVLGVIEMSTLQPDRWGSGVGLELAACAGLCWRLRFPFAAPMAALAAVMLIPVLGTPMDEPVMPIAVCALAFFSLGRYVADHRALLGFGVILVGIWVDYQWFDSRSHNLSDVAFVLVLAAPPFILGRLLGRLTEQRIALEQAQARVRAQAVRDERDRIARDLHDLLSHSISAMVVQTAAAQDLVRADPTRAEAVLADVADTGRKTLAESGRLLHVLRDTDDEIGLGPTPGLAQLPGLVDRFRTDGLRVELAVADPMPMLPAGVDVSAYRIIQEALTNALRYGDDRTASLNITCVGGTIRICSSNPSHRHLPTAGSGLGLLGMAERVMILGGTLSHGVTAEGQFELAATLPVAP